MPTNEYRRAKRKPFEHTAVMDYGDGAFPTPCEIADISDGGACLVVFGDLDLVPERFMLWLSPNGAVKRECRTAWRRNGCVGVQFLKGGVPVDKTRAPNDETIL